MDNFSKKMNEIELLAPVGSFPSLQAAINAGADAVYFGIGNLHMRSCSAKSFSKNDLKEIKQITDPYGIKTYLTLNTVLYDDEIKEAEELCDLAKTNNVSAVIASDMGILQYAKKIGLPIHASTQCNITNIESVRFYAQFADTIVLARELSLNQIQRISASIQKEDIRGPSKEILRIEAFAHGALCIAISGKCYMSQTLYNSSANRGACLQACRRKYRLFDEESGDELLLDNHYIMSPKDLCTIGHLDQMIDAGISILKIEGRARSPEYVHTVISNYKEALNSLKNNTYTKEKTAEWIENLKKVYNRGFWQGGYYFAKSLDSWSKTYGSQAKIRKKYLGKVTNFFKKNQIVECLLDNPTLKPNSSILFIGNKTGVAEFLIKDFKIHPYWNNKKTIITFPIPFIVRKNDEIYLLEKKI